MIRTIATRAYTAFLFLIAGFGGAILILCGEPVRNVAQYNVDYVGGR